jgi:phospholipid transport system transporter-binding protein
MFGSTEADRVTLAGALTFATAPALATQGNHLLAARAAGGAGEPFLMDLQGVTGADSAGLALLIGWIAEARRLGVTLRYHAVPERLLAIARISEVDGLLSGQTA